MNYWWILLVVVVVVFMFSGGKVEKKGGKSVIHSFPTKLKSSARSLTSGNKMVIGVLVGLALCWFLGGGVEGALFDIESAIASDEEANSQAARDMAEDTQIIADCCPQGGGGANQTCADHFQAHDGVWGNFLETYNRLCN
jgi:hypothetical protein